MPFLRRDENANCNAGYPSMSRLVRSNNASLATPCGEVHAPSTGIISLLLCIKGLRSGHDCKGPARLHQPFPKLLQILLMLDAFDCNLAQPTRPTKLFGEGLNLYRTGISSSVSMVVPHTRTWTRRSPLTLMASVGPNCQSLKSKANLSKAGKSFCIHECMDQLYSRGSPQLKKYSYQ